MFCNVIVFFLFIGLVEVGFGIYIMYGKINEEDFKREKWKLLVEGILVMIGSVIGGLFG